MENTLNFLMFDLCCVVLKQNDCSSQGNAPLNAHLSAGAAAVCPSGSANSSRRDSSGPFGPKLDSLEAFATTRTESK